MTPRLKIALILICAAGALRVAAPAQVNHASRQAVPTKSDIEIEADIKRRFAGSKSKDENFTVKVRNGVATLEGRTNVSQRKGSATRMAKSAGAKQVNNLIQVSEAAKKKAAEGYAKRRVQVTRSERP